MARISKGILGGFSGTVGNVVGGFWKGISYMRSQSTAKRTSFTPAQLQQQARFALAIKFLQPMNALLEITFRKQAVFMTGINSALSYTLKNAVTGIYPAFTIDYSMALVSRGDLPNAGAPTTTTPAGGQVSFSWTDNSGSGKASASDKAIFVVYCEALNQCIYITNGPLRSAGTGILQVPSFSGQLVQTYIAFISADGKDIATSMFTGKVPVL